MLRTAFHIRRGGVDLDLRQMKTISPGSAIPRVSAHEPARSVSPTADGQFRPSALPRCQRTLSAQIAKLTQKRLQMLGRGRPAALTSSP